MASDLLTPQDIVRQLSKLGNELDLTVDLLREAESDMVEKRHTANMTESQAFVMADGSVEMRKHLARLATDKQESEALVAEALVRHLRRRISAIGDRIEIGRSYGAAVRSELRMLPNPDTP